MKQKAKRILFTHYGDNMIRGSERCLLDLIKHLDRKLFTPIVWCNSQLLASEVKKMHIKVITDDFPVLFCGASKLSDFKRFYQNIKTGLNIVTNENIDLIHANSGAPNQWMNIVARIKKLPLLSHLHARYPLRERMALGLLNPSLTVGVSQPVIDQLLGNGINSKKVKVIPNGIDTDFQDKAIAIDLRQKLGIKPEDFVVMTTASLIHRKGIDLLIRVTSYLKVNHVPIHLVIAGDGPEKESLNRLSKEFKLENQVHFIGECHKVAAWLRGGVDVFASAAREEVFGLVLAEANLASLPVIAPRVGGIPEVIQHEKTGLLVEPESALSLAAAITHLYNHPELRKQYGQAGRKRVLKEFNIEKNVSRFQTTYLDLINHSEKHLNLCSSWNIHNTLKMIIRCVHIYLKNWVSLFSRNHKNSSLFSRHA